jgi:ribosome-associated protein
LFLIDGCFFIFGIIYNKGVILAKTGKPRSSKGLAVLAARLADQKLADNILIMNLTGIDGAPTDYFVICSCDSDVQIRAIVDLIATNCRQLGLKQPRVEGNRGSSWVLLDFFDVVMHIMLPDARQFYKLENLWGDSEFISLNEDGKPKAVRKKVPSLLSE